MIHKLSQKLTIALLALVSSAPVFAQRVQPMIFELAPFGREAQTTLRVENTKQEPITICLLYTSPSPRDLSTSRMPSSA